MPTLRSQASAEVEDDTSSDENMDERSDEEFVLSDFDEETDMYPYEYRGPFVSTSTKCDEGRLSDNVFNNRLYAKLMSSVEVNEELPEPFQCWTIVPTDGVYKVERTRKFKLRSRGSTSISATKLVAEYTYGRFRVGTKTANICGKGKDGCVRPSHLCVEARNTSISRDKCIGYVRLNDKMEQTVECNHTPRCLTFVTVKQ